MTHEYSPVNNARSVSNVLANQNQVLQGAVPRPIRDLSQDQLLDTQHLENLSDFGSPKRGPTLSTSTSSFEALDPHDPNLSHLASLMFSHTSSYLQGELSSVLEDYQLLEQMNKATITKYADMRQIASSINKSLNELNDKYIALQPYLDQIDQIEDSVTKLETAAYKLDAYSKRLEAKFKSLERK